MTTEPLRVLVADDEEGIRQVFQSILSPEPVRNKTLSSLEAELFDETPASRAPAPEYELRVVAQGADAVTAVREAIEANKPFRVAFLDMRMPPGMDGADTAAEIRKLDPLVNIVLVTGYSDLDVAQVAARVPPHDKLFFIAKPFQPAEIRQQAAALCARWAYEHRLVRELQSMNRELRLAAHEALNARVAAENANLAKSSFLANVSHELRTPLNAIIGFSDIMSSELYGPLGDPRYLDYSKEINNSGTSLLGAINDVIDTARLDLGKIDLALEPIDLMECVTRVIGDLSTFAARRVVSVVPPDAGTSAVVSADRKRVQQIVYGILHNAIKFSPAGGEVALKLASAGLDIVVEISDQGPGIAPELIEAAKGVFVQGDNVFTRTHGGLGLGLTLASRLLALHQGKLEFSVRPGNGTTVRLHFPAAAAAVRAA